MSSDSRETTNPDSDSANIDPTAVMRIKDLQLQAKIAVDGFFSGLHRSPVHGAPVEFSEYRPYTVGDDLRGLDWKLYARSDRYFIKKFEDETNRNCYLILDQSKSMGYGSLEYTKIQYARTLAATLVYYLMRQRDSVGLVTFDDSIGDFISAKHRVGQFHQLMVCLSKPLRGTGTDISGPLRQIASLVHRRGLIVLISDLLTPVDSLQTNLAYLRSRGHEVVILRVLDPSELDLQLTSPSMVVDMESSREIYIDPDAARSQYKERFTQHQTEIREVCDSLGVDLYQMVTDSPLEDALFHVIDAQQRRRRGSSRGGMLPGASRREMKS